MRLSFNTQSIRDICERDRDAINAFGEQSAELLHDALAELHAAPTIGDISDWDGRMLPRKHADQLAFQFGGVLEVAFSVNHIRRPTEANGDLAWDRVSSIKILKVEVKNGEGN